MLQIFHNPKCGKCREGLAILEKVNIEFEIIKYLDTPPTKTELLSILEKMKMNPLTLVRIKEQVWIDNFKGKTLSDDQIIDAMIQYPILIERPIVINGNKAIIGRPTSKIHEIL